MSWRTDHVTEITRTFKEKSKEKTERWLVSCKDARLKTSDQVMMNSDCLGHSNVYINP